MATKLIHVSDLHVGGHEEPVDRGASARARRAPRARADRRHGRPHAPRPRRAARARRRLPPRRSGRPCSPFPAITTSRIRSRRGSRGPWREFEQHWETTEPVFRSAEPARRRAELGAPVATPVGRARRGGARARGRRGWARRRRARCASSCLHHHLTGAPWRSRKRPVARRGHVLGALVDAGAELILSGHIHQSAASERREFEVGLSRRAERRDRHRPRARPAAAEAPRRSPRPARDRRRRARDRASRPSSSRRRVHADRGPPLPAPDASSARGRDTDLGRSPSRSRPAGLRSAASPACRRTPLLLAAPAPVRSRGSSGAVPCASHR